MRGSPKIYATKQDFINLLSNDQFAEEAKKKLQEIYDVNDSKATKATTPLELDDPILTGWNTIEIDNPMPMWKQKGFASRQEVAELIAEY